MPLDVVDDLVQPLSKLSPFMHLFIYLNGQCVSKNCTIEGCFAVTFVNQINFESNILL